MKSRKILSAVAIISALVVFAACSNKENAATNGSTSSTLDKSALLAPTLKNPKDIDAFNTAVTSNNLSLCDKVTDSNYKTQCQAVIANPKTLVQALSSLDISICSQMLGVGQKEDCQKQIEAKQAVVANTTKAQQDLSAQQKLAQAIYDSKDYTRCKELTMQSMQKDCEINILVHKVMETKDPSWCKKASTDEIKNQCKSIVDELNLY